MDNTKDIRDAIAARFIAINGTYEALTEWENVVFDPTNRPLWFRFFYMPDVPNLAELGSGGSDECKGFAQIDINVPIGTGDKVARETADAIRSAFTSGTHLIKNSVNVIITRCGPSPGRQVGNFHRVSISIYFETRLRRN